MGERSERDRQPQANSTPRVSGSINAKQAAPANAAALAPNAQGKPCRSLNTPIVTGASALNPRATLYEIPNAVARFSVGKISLAMIPDPVKNPVPKNAATHANRRIHPGCRAPASSGTAAS